MVCKAGSGGLRVSGYTAAGCFTLVRRCLNALKFYGRHDQTVCVEGETRGIHCTAPKNTFRCVHTVPIGKLGRA